MNGSLTYSCTDDGIVHACVTLQGKPRNVCGVNYDKVVARLFDGPVTCLGCIARLADAEAEAKEEAAIDSLTEQLRASIGKESLVEYAVGDAEAVLAFTRALNDAYLSQNPCGEIPLRRPSSDGHKTKEPPK